jgi:hypothetical protein
MLTMSRWHAPHGRRHPAWFAVDMRLQPGFWAGPIGNRARVVPPENLERFIQDGQAAGGQARRPGEVPDSAAGAPCVPSRRADISS